MTGTVAHTLSQVTQFECLEPELDGNIAKLHYQATDGTRPLWAFTEQITFPVDFSEADQATTMGILRLLALAASMSYFKAFAPTKYVVPSGLTAAEREYITRLIAGGLGEFAFVNQLPEVLDSIVIAPELVPASVSGERSVHRAGQSTGQLAMQRTEQTSEVMTTPSRPAHTPHGASLLVAVGGGKDSIVSIESLRGTGYNVSLFGVNPKGPIVATADQAALPLHAVQRSLDPQLFQLNTQGAPNGHIPVTAINSTIAVLLAHGLGLDGVVFSNEAGSSYGNFAWAGRMINHQWSKGIEFEQLLRASLPVGAPDYVSLLRPINEIRIARRFASLTQYHSVFTSCNRAFRIHDASASWCGDCPKCRFIFLMLAPFLSRAALLDIFDGRDLFADVSQRTGFLELFGVDGLLKPFECVGEPDECRVALTLVREQPDWAGHEFLADPLVAQVSSTEAEAAAVFAWREAAHCLSPELAEVAHAI